MLSNEIKPWSSLDPPFCDVDIESSDGVTIPANKTILMIRSEYFASVFNSNNNLEGTKAERVKMPFTKTVVEKLIQYIYSGQMDGEEMSPGSLLKLMDLPKEFSAVEGFTEEKIKDEKFLIPHCFKSLYNYSKLASGIVQEASMYRSGTIRNCPGSKIIQKPLKSLGCFILPNTI